MKTGIERREGERVSRVVAIKHRLIKRVGRKSPSEWGLSTTKDMSHSGLLFLSEAPYRKGDVLELQVVMSAVIDIFKGKAQVMRVVDVAGASYYVGVRFLNPKIPARKAKSHIKK